MSGRGDLDALEGRLAQAWREDAVPGVDPRWKAGVMDAVRAAAARGGAGPSAVRIVRNAFLAAAAAAVLAAVPLAAVRTTTIDPSAGVARLLAGDPQGLLCLVLLL
jgi:hypothetical protein